MKLYSISTASVKAISYAEARFWSLCLTPSQATDAQGTLNDVRRSVLPPYAPTTFVTVGLAGPAPPSFIGTT